MGWHNFTCFHTIQLVLRIFSEQETSSWKKEWHALFQDIDTQKKSPPKWDIKTQLTQGWITDGEWIGWFSYIYIYIFTI